MPTQCSADLFGFAPVEGRRVEAGFDGGTITSDAGALLLGATDRVVGLVGRLAGCFVDARRPDLIEHDVATLIAQRVFGIARGYEDLNDHQHLRHDPLWQALAEYDPGAGQPLASAATLCRLENRASRAALWRLAAVLVEQFIASFASPPHTLVLDFDATDDPVHG